MSSLYQRPAFVFDNDPFGDGPQPAFHGESFEPALDQVRLTTQLDRVRALMADAQWRTLAEIHAVVPGSEAALSARLRDLRKLGWIVARRRRGEPSSGLWEYAAQQVER